MGAGASTGNFGFASELTHLQQLRAAFDLTQDGGRPQARKVEEADEDEDEDEDEDGDEDGATKNPARNDPTVSPAFENGLRVWETATALDEFVGVRLDDKRNVTGYENTTRTPG